MSDTPRTDALVAALKAGTTDRDYYSLCCELEDYLTLSEADFKREAECHQATIDERDEEKQRAELFESAATKALNERDALKSAHEKVLATAAYYEHIGEDLAKWKGCAEALAVALEGNALEPRWKALARFNELKGRQ